MSSHQHDRPDLAPPRVVEVSDGVYGYLQPDGSWWINNTGFLVGRRGVTSIDSCSTERRTRDYLTAIAGVSGLPIRTLINTHHHGDHTFGNYLFASATVVGHERARQDALAFGLPFSAPIWEEVEWGDIELEPPFLTFTEAVTLHVDELRVDVRHVGGPAHTNNDCIVWIPERKVLFSGDLIFNGGTPFVLMGSVAGSLDVLENLRGLGAETIVPGHGEVTGPEVIDDVARYLTFVLRLAEEGRAAGLTPLELAREADLSEFAHLTDGERTVGNLHRAYAELGGLERGGEIDLFTAFTDMVAYNGGRPLSCLA
ncbi:MBL fold metallo-hydrolase [Actinomadura sp. HBU206391]|uniref:MBL fold metallo-hydrolase n=1 Tax=Actinomadura sp. HBU206391 TaxID=2731692 RepID=UPI00164F5429|nr:MBL fold metallo-hydrolase [Actinomadura sp. HBU206391]MBC6463732.1 MBL fold metallo-hydrolase [Actinomadura sp. HBU206391]